jgi:5-methylcytosine-specific restriction protein B
MYFSRRDAVTQFGTDIMTKKLNIEESKQLILFGGPGTGKSHFLVNQALPELGIDIQSGRSWKTVFHPDYSYGDFMGRLLPTTVDGKVEYNFFPGHFLEALAGAYKAILRDEDGAPQNCALVIDEINRGNATAIFGSIFQLLDRGTDGWSSYSISLSKLEYEHLLQLLGIEVLKSSKSSSAPGYKYNGQLVTSIEKVLEPIRIVNQQISLPPNLYLLATMNTSETSVYYMDSAFKRRWEWQYFSPKGQFDRDDDIVFKSSNSDEWRAFLDKLNAFFVKNAVSIRSLEDKQIGYYFMNKTPIRYSDVQNKLMFFIWDSVFQRDKSPLEVLLGKGSSTTRPLVTFGDFAAQVRLFVDRVNISV